MGPGHGFSEIRFGIFVGYVQQLGRVWIRRLDVAILVESDTGPNGWRKARDWLRCI